MALKHIYFTLFFLLALVAKGQTVWVNNLNDAGAGSLREAVLNAQPGATINFSDSLLSGQNDTLVLSQEIIIKKQLTLNGLDHDTAKLYISGNNATRILRLKLDSAAANMRNVTINNFYFTKAQSTNGSALKIDFANFVLVQNSSFTQCQATNGGAAVFARSYSLTKAVNHLVLENCMFSQNGGGSFSNTYFYQVGTVEFKNSIIQQISGRGNYATFCDGYFIINTIVVNNGLPNQTTNATVFTLPQTDSLYVDNMLAENNNTSGNGAVFNLHNTFGSFIENSTFKNNKAEKGGVAYGTSSEIKFRNCIIKNNYAKYGGVLWADHSFFEGCTIFKNESQSYGGVVANLNSSSLNYCTFLNCQLDSNLAGGEGSVASLRKVDFKFLNSTAAYNTSGSSAVFSILHFSKIKVDKSTISSNMSQSQGGVFQLGTYCNPKIYNSTIVKNSTAAQTGGFIYNNWADSVLVKSSIVAQNGASPIVHYSNGSIGVFSEGYNLLDLPNVNSLPSDINNADSTILRLGPLQNNGGNLLTHLPQASSFAINRGNPLDFSTAQNDTIYAGRRDIGAAESTDSTKLYAQEMAICDSVFFNQNWINTIGIYTDTTNSNWGKDSIVWLHITSVNQAVVDTQFIESCQPITWINGDTYAQNTDTNYVVLANANGCDSTVYLNFTRLTKAIQDTQFITSCEPILWIDGNVYSQTTNTPFVLFSNAKNCDSTVYLNFTFDPIDTAVNIVNGHMWSLDSTAQYLWVDCDNGFKSLIGGNTQSYPILRNGNFAVILKKDGCTDTSRCIAVNNFTVEEFETSNVKVYPNPTSGNFQLEMPAGNGLWHVSVINAKGILVGEAKAHPNEKLTLFLPGSAGLFLVRYTNGSVQNSVRILKR